MGLTSYTAVGGKECLDFVFSAALLQISKTVSYQRLKKRLQ